jgi:indolepyruvate decarboxylase
MRRQEADGLVARVMDALVAAGARHAFGIPGDFALPMFAAMERHGGLHLHTLSHEPGVGFAADACARAAGAPVVAAVTYGAGALNMVNAVACAYAEKSPVVVLSGAPGRAERGSGLLVHHQSRDLDSQIAVMREVTCDQAVLDDPARAPGEVARVLRSLQERSRPVYLEIPRDVVDQPTGPVPAAAPTPVDPDAVAACAEEVLGRLTAARRPVVMAGVEVRRYGLEDRVAALCRTLGVPAVTDFLGMGLLAEADAPLAGAYLGPAGDPAVAALVEDADLALLLGVILTDTNFGVSERRVDMRGVVHAIDREVRLGHHVYPGVPLGALVDALAARAVPRAAPAVPPPPVAARDLPADDAPIHPDDIATAVNDLFARHGPMPMAVDTGDCLFLALGIPGAPLVAPGYYATMGFGVPAGLGVQAATGRRPLVLVGDGAFQMTGLELGNCARHGWDPVVVVVDNEGWEMLRAFQPGAAYNARPGWRYAELADALGGTGRRATTRAELAAALAAAVAERGRFQLIEARVPPGARSGSLERFVRAVAEGRAAAG